MNKYDFNLENEQLELAEQDYLIKKAEQKRFESSFQRHYAPLEPREARMQDMEIYKLGRLEF